jgi:hypothetical protein
LALMSLNRQKKDFDNKLVTFIDAIKREKDKSFTTLS